jgi:hypothetical protein
MMRAVMMWREVVWIPETPQWGVQSYIPWCYSDDSDVVLSSLPSRNPVGNHAYASQKGHTDMHDRTRFPFFPPCLYSSALLLLFLLYIAKSTERFVQKQ